MKEEKTFTESTKAILFVSPRVLTGEDGNSTVGKGEFGGVVDDEPAVESFDVCEFKCAKFRF